MLKPVTRIAAACALIFGSSSQAATLQEVIRQSFANDPELLEAKANVDAANTDIKIAKSGHLPIVSLTASQVLAQKHRYESNERPRGINPGLQGRLNLYSFGGVDARVRYSEHKHDYFHHKYYETQETVGQTIGKLYLAALRAKENIVAAQGNLQRHHQIIKDLQIITKYDKGRQSELDQAMARRLRVQAYLAEQSRSMELYLSRLGKYTNNRLNPVALTDPFAGENASSIVKRYQSMDLGQQPSYQAQQSERASVLAELDVNKSARYPAIDLIAAASRDNKEIYLNFNWDFFSPSANFQVEKSSQTLAAAEAKSDQILRDVVERSRSAEVDMRQSLNRVGVAQQQIAAQHKVIKAYELQFKIARRTLIDVLDAYSDLWNIESEVVAAQNDFRDAALEYLSSQSSIARFAGVVENRQSPERYVRRRFRDHLPETFLPPSLQERFDKIDFDAIGEEFKHLGDQLNYLKDKTKTKLDKILPEGDGNVSVSAAPDIQAASQATDYPVIIDENTLIDSNQPYQPRQLPNQAKSVIKKSGKSAKSPTGKSKSSGTGAKVSVPSVAKSFVAQEQTTNTPNPIVLANTNQVAVAESPSEPRPDMHPAQAMPSSVLTYDDIMNQAPVSLPQTQTTPSETDSGSLKNMKNMKNKNIDDSPNPPAKPTDNPTVSGSLKVNDNPVLNYDDIANHQPASDNKLDNINNLDNLGKQATVLNYDDITATPKVATSSPKIKTNSLKTTKPIAKPAPVLSLRSKDKANQAQTSKTATAHTKLATPAIKTKKLKDVKLDKLAKLVKQTNTSSETTTPVKLVESPEHGVILNNKLNNNSWRKQSEKKQEWLKKSTNKAVEKSQNHFENMLQEPSPAKKSAPSNSELPKQLNFDARVPYQ